MIYEAVVIFFGVVAGLALIYAAALKCLTDGDQEEDEDEDTPLIE